MVIGLFVLLIPSLITASRFSGLDGRIVNGIPISANQYPWMVSLRVDITNINHKNGTNTTQSFQNCGGSLIGLSPPTVLTAAHCVDGIFNYSTNTTLYDWFVDINRTYDVINTPNDTYYTLPMYERNIHVHPKWNWSAYDGHDIALFISDEELPETAQNKLQPYLPSISSVTPCCESGEELTIIGYGFTATGGNDSTVLRSTNVRYLNDEECGNKLKEILMDLALVNGSLPDNVTTIDFGFGVDIDTSDVETLEELTEAINEFALSTNIYENTLICIAGDDTDACYGDSGGPLFKTSDDIHDITLLGVTSFGPEEACNAGAFSGYTDIASYYDWIVDVTGYTIISTKMPESTRIADGAKSWIGNGITNWMFLCIYLLYVMIGL